MTNFEKIPSASEPERKENGAENVAARLAEHLYAWRRLYAHALVYSTAAALDFSAMMLKINEEETKGKPPSAEAVPSLDVDLRFDELRALDPEASPERLRRIIETLPKGYVGGDVASIGFTDERYPMHESYGAKLVNDEAAGTAAGGRHKEKTAITFWQGAKGETSDQLWNGTLLHEIAHANDWDTDSRLDAAEREELRVRVAARVRSADRYVSAYVESISNPDPAAELDIKAKEYWAEINEAYLSGELDERTDPFNADFELVREFIAKQDPDFDKDEALARRKITIGDMTNEESVEAYGTLPQSERDAVEARMDRRARLAAGEGDPSLQRQGREEIVAAYRRWGKTEAGKNYLVSLSVYNDELEKLFDARTRGETGQLYLEYTAAAYHALKAARAGFGPDADRVRGEIEDVMKDFGVWIGWSEQAMRMDPGEYDAYGFTKAEAWISYDLGWRRPDYERLTPALEDYLQKKVFGMPEDK